MTNKRENLQIQIAVNMQKESLQQTGTIFERLLALRKSNTLRYEVLFGQYIPVFGLAAVIYEL